MLLVPSYNSWATHIVGGEIYYELLNPSANLYTITLKIYMDCQNGNPQAIQSGELTLDFILDERSRELHWEAHRRQDLIRFGKYTGGSYNWAWKGNGSNGISLPDHMKLFPIPAASLSTNPNLTQNPGY